MVSIFRIVFLIMIFSSFVSCIDLQKDSEVDTNLDQDTEIFNARPAELVEAYMVDIDESGDDS